MAGPDIYCIIKASSVAVNMKAFINKKVYKTVHYERVPHLFLSDNTLECFLLQVDRWHVSPLVHACLSWQPYCSDGFTQGSNNLMCLFKKLVCQHSYRIEYIEFVVFISLFLLLPVMILHNTVHCFYCKEKGI